MTTRPAPVDRATAPDVETVILDLCRVLIGDGERDRGLMSHMVNGGQHIETCQRGMWIQAGDSLRGGQPCSKRCLAVQAAISQAGRWLRAHEAPLAVQAAMFESERAVGVG